VVDNTIKNAEEKHKEELEKRDKQKQMFEVHRTLKELQRVFHANCLQQEYVRARFENTVAIVNQNLNTLNAGFIVRISADDKLRYEYCSNEQPDEWYDMEELSGGQRIRLCLAFVLSVQQTICPDNNFLTLDEPSEHLDAQAVASLGELFVYYSQKLAGDDGQLWVVDHKEELKTSIAKHFELSEDLTKSNTKNVNK